ncbi:MAG: DUF4956 domain-containing protein [Candidatus Latescibacteria bacterium]|nr:DUF4956 domain-containing protein [Candidatus Latescibacterota bacterium]
MNNIQNIYDVFQFSFSAGEFIRNMIVALLCGFLISRFYCWSTKSMSNSRTFTSSLITLTMITAVVIIVIGNNLARAFGLVGAMSIIRFRTAVKDVQDIVFIFYSLAIGMAAGRGLAVISFIGTISIGLVIVGISLIHSYTPMKLEYLLQFSFVPIDYSDPPYLPLLKYYCKKYQLINMKSFEHNDQLELSFYINLKDSGKRENFMLELRQIEGVKNINLFFDEQTG